MKKFFKILIKVIVSLFAVVGFLTILLIVFSVSMIGFRKAGVTRIPSKVILELNLEKPLVEYVPEDPLGFLLMYERTTVRDVVDALKRAKEDDRVVGLVAKVGSSANGLAVLQEIRDAVAQFGSEGKFTVAYSETFGEFGPGNGSYYLASVFDQIYLQPSGDLNLTGLMYESPFVKGTLEKLKIEPRMDHRKEFKNAMNMFTEDSYTESHREAIETLMRSQYDQIVEGICQSRGLAEQELISLMDNAPLLGAEAVEANLVDELLYRDQVYEKVREKVAGAEFLYLNKYLARAGRVDSEGERIALIYGVGSVHRGSSEYSGFADSPSMGSDTLTAAFRAAVADEKVKAIVFRVDSPGGSYVASDTIWREVVNARQAGKPVVVTMGDVAGSGGYFVAMAANKIVAQPGTITGSIGVVAGKMLTREFWKEITGITWDEVHTNNNSTMWTGTSDYTDQQWQQLQLMLDRIYEDFTSKVADGRGMELDDVLEIAKGRIWSGRDAFESGLVDELGGFETALRLARTEAGLKEDAPIEVVVYPRPRTLVEVIFKKGRDSSEPKAELVAIRQMFDIARPIYKMAFDVGLVGEKDVLLMPTIERKW